MLLAQANLRLKRLGASNYSAEDLVQDVWLVALPKLSDVTQTSGSETQRILAFLGRILLNLYGNLLQRRLRANSRGLRDPAGGVQIEDLPGENTGVITEAVRDESCTVLQQALNDLSDIDRELIVLRLMEQISNEVVASLLGIKPNTASARYRRALQRLRRQLPQSVFGDLPD